MNLLYKKASDNPKKIYSENVSLELVYIGWDFGDHHYDNFRAILDYNSS
jgi:hypothetical protein